MRVSVDKRDKGFRFDLDLTRVKVFLDDKPFIRAVTADEEESLIVAHKYSEDGKPVINDAGDAYVLETLRGKVRIEIVGDDGQSIRTPKVKVERSGATFVVYVYSRIRAKNIRRMTLDKDLILGFDEEQLAQACGMAAGAAGEHLCEQFGDVFDPSATAQAGIDACRELLANEAKGLRH